MSTLLDNRGHGGSLDQEHQTLRAVLDGIDDVVYVSDRETYEILQANVAFCQLFGEGVIGRKCYEVLQGQGEPCSFCTNDEIFGESLGRSYVWEQYDERTKRWFRRTDKAIRWIDGRMVRLEIAGDITELKQTMEAYRASEVQFRTLVTQTEEIVYMIDRDGTFLLSEGKGLAKMGIEPGQVVGASVFDLYKDFPQMLDDMRRAFAGETVLNEAEVAGIHFRSWYSPFLGIDGEVEGLLGLSIDITDQKEAEAAVRRNAAELARSNADLQQFAYVASHDLREPLRMVASYTQLLARRYEGQLDDKADKYIHYAVDGARRMQGLINDLLAFSRIGTQGKVLEPVDSAEVFGHVKHDLEQLVHETGAEIVTGDLPTVLADRTQLAQVFQNLVANAIEFRGEAPPRIEVAACRRGTRWEITVADNGIGIEPEFHERIFVIFQRLHERGRYDGTGIGLSVVKKIVERHGGHITLDSSPGEGACFTFSLAAVH